MIAILFTAGNFGSTIEYCLRQFSQELTKVTADVLSDGSMHGFNKELHPVLFSDCEDLSGVEIITPVFPNKEYLSGRACIEWYRTALADQKVILIDSPDRYQAERCQLFAYHKNRSSMLDIIMKDKASSWNPVYSHWRDMRRSELREALSLYIDQQSDLVDMKRYVPEAWYTVSPQSIIDDLPRQIQSMLDFSGLTYNGQSIEAFYCRWLAKQQYILKEAETTDQILRAITMDQSMSWQPLSIMGEAILQSRLRRMRQELDMSDLEALPCDSVKLRAHFF